jgi:hypothetical protein
LTPSDRSKAPASKTHVFPGVTLEALASLRDQAGGNGGGNYALKLDPNSAAGLLTTHTPMGDVVVRFSHNSERNELTLTIVKKPMLLPTAAIITGTSQVLRHAANQATRPAAKSVGND